MLRLVLALLAGVPGSSGLSEQAANFASAHLDMLARVLQEAANPATAAWAPGDEELEMAALAVSLLSMLPGALSAGSKGALTGLRRDMWRLWLVLAGHDRKDGTAASSIVVSRDVFHVTARYTCKCTSQVLRECYDLVAIAMADQRVDLVCTLLCVAGSFVRCWCRRLRSQPQQLPPPQEPAAAAEVWLSSLPQGFSDTSTKERWPCCCKQ